MREVSTEKVGSVVGQLSTHYQNNFQCAKVSCGKRRQGCQHRTHHLPFLAADERLFLDFGHRLVEDVAGEGRRQPLVVVVAVREHDEAENAEKWRLRE